MFITNNHTSFHLWWKENLVRHQKVSKYYDHDCSLTLSYNRVVRGKMVSRRISLQNESTFEVETGAVERASLEE